MQLRCRSGGDDARVFARDYADVGGGLLCHPHPSFEPLLSFNCTTSPSPVHDLLLSHHSTPLLFIRHVARHLMQTQPYFHVVRRTSKSLSSRMKNPAAPYALQSRLGSSLATAFVCRQTFFLQTTYPPCFRLKVLTGYCALLRRPPHPENSFILVSHGRRASAAALKVPAADLAGTPVGALTVRPPSP